MFESTSIRISSSASPYIAVAWVSPIELSFLFNCSASLDIKTIGGSPSPFQTSAYWTVIGGPLFLSRTIFAPGGALIWLNLSWTFDHVSSIKSGLTDCCNSTIMVAYPWDIIVSNSNISTTSLSFISKSLITCVSILSGDAPG